MGVKVKLSGERQRLSRWSQSCQGSGRGSQGGCTERGVPNLAWSVKKETEVSVWGCRTCWRGGKHEVVKGPGEPLKVEEVNVAWDKVKNATESLLDNAGWLEREEGETVVVFLGRLC